MKSFDHRLPDLYHAADDTVQQAHDAFVPPTQEEWQSQRGPRPEDRSGDAHHWQAAHPDILTTALKLTGGDTSRFKLMPDGSIVIRNPR